MLNVTAATLRRTVQRGTGRVASARNSYGQHSSQRPYSTPPGTPPEGLKPVLKSGNWILTGAMVCSSFWKHFFLRNFVWLPVYSNACQWDPICIY